MRRTASLFRRFWSLSWWIKAPALAFAALVVLAVIGAAVGASDNDQDAPISTPTATPSATVTAAWTPRPTVTPRSTDTPPPTATATPEPTATSTPELNRQDCDAIRGTPYRSPEERDWFLANCTTAPPPSSAPNCHPSYLEACLLTDIGDYDCWPPSGETEPGPNWVYQPVQVVGYDEFGLDGNDNDGRGCEGSGPPSQEPEPPPQQPPKSSDCDPSYPEVCIPVGAADYDCAGGSGNGPNYIEGPIRVLPPDPHDLDRDGDGWGCE